MLKGLTLTPPVVGRISIGRVLEHDGERRPDADDEFTITTQVQHRGDWLRHPVDAALRKAQCEKQSTAEEGGRTGSAKLRAIPVRLLFDDPALNLRASYSAFDSLTGRPLCTGDGESSRRATPEGIKTLVCPSPEGCEWGQAHGCKPYARLTVRIGDEDELDAFIFRTAGFNSIRTLAARLQHFKALSGDALTTLPLELRLRGKSTVQSSLAPIFYVDLTLRGGSTVAQTLAESRRLRQAQRDAGVDQQALDQAARAGFAAGAFEETPEDGPFVVQQFYPPAPAHLDSGDSDGATAAVPSNPGAASQRSSVLRGKLDRLAQAQAKASAPPAPSPPPVSSAPRRRRTRERRG